MRIKTLVQGSVAGLAAGLVVAVPAHAQAGPPAEVRDAVGRLVADGQPGVIAMGRRDGRTFRVTAGVADTATGTPMDARQHFRVASVTKTFTSTLVLRLAARHRLSLDDKVGKWLPGVVHRNGNDGSRITIRQLLAQTSGLPEYALDPAVQTRPQRVWKPRELVDIAQQSRPLYRPGHGWNYSNTNYILAGMIIEKASGRSYAAELRREITGPLHLTRTTLPVKSRALPEPYVHGYFGDYGDVSTLVSPSSAWASGGIVSTVGDVARFHRALVTGRLLPERQQRALMTTRPVTDDWIREDYGLGLARIRTSCGYAWGHDGGFPGYRTWSYTTSDGRRQAVITYNQSSPALEATPAFRTHLTDAIDKTLCA